MATEKKITIETMLAEISQVHNLSSVTTVIIDKDFNEMAALKKMMSHARIQLCKFHVMQTMNQEIKKCRSQVGIKPQILFENLFSQDERIALLRTR